MCQISTGRHRMKNKKKMRNATKKTRIKTEERERGENV